MPAPRLTVYTKPECHLCDIAKARIEALRRHLDFEIETVDITRSADLLARYGERIPVVTLAGEEVGALRINGRRLAEKLKGAGARTRFWSRLLGRTP